jgi:hypothetical protein
VSATAIGVAATVIAAGIVKAIVTAIVTVAAVVESAAATAAAVAAGVVLALENVAVIVAVVARARKTVQPGRTMRMATPGVVDQVGAAGSGVAGQSLIGHRVRVMVKRKVSKVVLSLRSTPMARPSSVRPVAQGRKTVSKVSVSVVHGRRARVVVAAETMARRVILPYHALMVNRVTNAHRLNDKSDVKVRTGKKAEDVAAASVQAPVWGPMPGRTRMRADRGGAAMLATTQRVAAKVSVAGLRATQRVNSVARLAAKAAGAAKARSIAPISRSMVVARASHCGAAT